MKIKKFETYKDPDLRKIGPVVLCIKDYKKNTIFKKDSYYKVDGVYGDPQGALEIGINDYLPVEFIGRVVLIDENNNREQFVVNIKNKYVTTGFEYSFFEYFQIPEFSEQIDKFNI